MSLRGLETAIFSHGYQPVWGWDKGDHPDFDMRVLRLVDKDGIVRHTFRLPFKARGAHTKDANYYESCKLDLFKMAEQATRDEPVIGGIRAKG
jgi:hypothetical protein